MDGILGLSGSFHALLAESIGKTITIFTTSGGQSGSGFTGVVLSANAVFVRLITRIGPSPSCSLGNACSGFGAGAFGHGGHGGAWHGGMGFGGGMLHGPFMGGGGVGAMSAGGWDGLPIYTVGSVTDIPIAAIASIVQNAV